MNLLFNNKQDTKPFSEPTVQSRRLKISYYTIILPQA